MKFLKKSPKVYEGARRNGPVGEFTAEIPFSLTVNSPVGEFTGGEFTEMENR